jgi:hypothetical protein
MCIDRERQSLDPRRQFLTACEINTLAGRINAVFLTLVSFAALVEGRVSHCDEDNPMKPNDFTDRQKQVLAGIAQRMRRQADQLDDLVRSGNSQRLAQACGMLHATETQLLWIRNGNEPREEQNGVVTEARE